MINTITIHVSRFLASGTGILSGEDPLSEPLSLFFVQAIIIIGICRFLSIIGIYFKQPRVIFEIIGGILIGPSALGKIPSFQNTLFSPTSPTAIPNLQLVANIGLVLYLFTIGMELDPILLIRNGKRAASIAICGMIVPFAFGVAISRTLFDTLQGNDPVYGNANFTAFFVFIGTALSITAFPVLARILKEGGLIYTKVGALTMGAAAVNDAIAWCLLILAISIANAGSMITAFYVFLSVLALACILFFVFAPFYKWLVATIESWNSTLWNSNLFALTLCLLFLLSWTTTLLGVHSIFGAFLFGLIIPRESHLFRECNEKIEELVLTLFLPLYFAASGLKTDITQINTSDQGAMIILVCVVATFGKLIGAGVPAYVSGMSFRESSVVAVLMNTRGLVELIVLNLGVSSGILNTKTFSVMVIMCLFTTFLTCPVVEAIYPKRMRVRIADEGEDKTTNALISRDDETLLPGSIAISINPSSCVSLEKLKDTLQLCVVVDELDRLQELMNVVTCFAPQSKAASMSLLAVKFVEPTNTKADQFVGVEDSGRVIKVDPEPTVYEQAYFNTPGTIRPQLLPLSMLCRSMGSSVSAFQVVGNPDEFPYELRSMSDTANSDFVLLPWRKNSVYFQSLFWGMLRTTQIPVMLFVHQASAQEESSPLDILTTRSRMSSTAMLTDMVRHLTTSPDKAAKGVDDSEEKTSGDIELAESKAEENNENEQFNFHNQSVSAPNSPNKYTVLSDAGHGHQNGHHMTVMKDAESGSLKHLSAIITGKDTDTYILSLMLRFAQNPRFEISVYVCKNYKLYSQATRRSVKQFYHTTSKLDNVKIVTIASECEDPEAIKSELIDVRGDILFTSFMLPESEQQMGPAATDDGSATAIAMRQSRTDSLHENREPGTHRGSLPPLPTLTTPDLRLAGVPEPLVTAGFTYPSLGRLGNTLLQYSEVPSFKFHCIMHEATSTNRMARAMTMLPEGVRNRPLSQAVPYDSASSLVSIGHSESVLSGGEKVSTPEADDESGSDDFGIEYSDSVDVRAELNLSDKKVN